MFLCTPVPAGSSLVGPEEKFRAGVNLFLLLLRGWEGEGHTADGVGNKNNSRGAAHSPSSMAPTGPEQSQCLLPTVGLAWVQDSGEVGEGVGFKVHSGLGRADAGGKAVGKWTRKVFSVEEMGVLAKQVFPNGVGWGGVGV